MITRKIKGISLITVIVVAAMLTGCVTDLDKQEESESSYISFETETRGTKITSGASITTMGVSASIYPAGNTYSSYGNGSYFHNLQVTPGVNTSYYWPASSYNLSFFAYYPYGDSNYRLTSAAAATGSPTYTVSVPTAIADQKDFMTGETIDRSAGVHTPVPMAFSHQTAAVNMNVTNSRSAAITLTSISINGVKYTGTLTGNAWSLNNSTRNFTLAYGSSIAAGATTAVTGTTNVFMMLPQTIPSGAKVKVVIDGTEEMEADITGTWEAGKNYIYNIDIKNNAIIVINNNTAIENWKDHYQQKYLTFEAIEDGTFSFTQTGLSYSLDDGETWTALAANTATPTVSAGNKILWKGELTASSSYGIGTFSSTGEYKCYGNTMSLIYGDDFREQTTLKNTYQFNKLFYNSTLLKEVKYLRLPATTLVNKYNCYQYMFYGCTGLTTAPKLPATILANYCYYSMFQGCTSLTTVPELPAEQTNKSCYGDMFRNCTSLTTVPIDLLPALGANESCYSGMFYNCTSLTTPPALPATYVAESCYSGMFQNCTSLTSIPMLPATTVYSWSYLGMFSGCTSLTSLPSGLLPATTLATYCYQGMFEKCTGLTTVPSDLLPATSLSKNCYQGMFKDCTGLTTAPTLPATSLADNCYDSMFQGCTSLTTAPTLPATKVRSSSYSGMFSGCTSLTTAPALPATTLNYDCYYGMFNGCTSLTTAPALPATTLASGCYSNMFKDCTSLTTAPELPATMLTSGCYNQMFYGCSNMNYIKAAFTSTPTTNITGNWVFGVSSTGTFYKNDAATWNVTGVYGVPSGWTIQTYTPE